MPHSHTSCLMHCVFSTKGRRGVLSAELRERLWPYIGGIARENGMTALVVGGTDDHAHILLSVPSTITVAKEIQLIKGGSSYWLNKHCASRRRFEWQQGYGAFSVGISQVDSTITYINNQESHHRRKTFEEEFRAFLKRHGIQYDERYVFG